MFNEYVSVFKRFKDFKGRSTRKEYWCFYAAQMIIYFLLGFLTGLVPAFAIILFIYYIVSAVPMIAVTVRRIHDTNHRWYFGLIPFYNIVILFLPGDENVNDFGASPYTAEVISENNANSTRTVYLYKHDKNNTEQQITAEEAGRQRFCPYCGNSISENAVFCSRCGKAIEKTIEKKICPQCRKEYGVDMVFCEECGSKLQ